MTGMDMLNALHIQGDETIAARLEKYNELVMEKNRVMNLTGIKDSGESLIKNVYDSLTVYDARYFPQGGSLLDLGTGAGFPGMILAILRPDMQVVLMDAIRKKLRFIEEAAEILGGIQRDGSTQPCGRCGLGRRFPRPFRRSDRQSGEIHARHFRMGPALRKKRRNLCRYERTGSPG